MKVVGVITLVFLQAYVAPAVAAPELLDVMPEVRVRLSQRASSLNQRTTTGQITEQDLVSKVPFGVRWAGERRVLEYLDTHHLSHVRSVKHHPKLAADRNNLVFEPAKSNLARGPKDMGFLDKLRVYSHNSSASLSAVLAKMKNGSIIGVLLELPVTGTVETLHVVNERKTWEEAMYDAAKAVGVAGLAGGVGAGALSAASAAGVTVGAPVVVPLAVVGGTAYVWVSSERVWQALDNETRAVIKAQQTAFQEIYQDYAQAMREQISTTIDQGREWIQKWWEED